MNDVLEIVSKLERTGGILSLNGDQIDYAIPKGSREAHDLLHELRKHREQVAEFLRLRTCESVERYPPESLDRLQRFGSPHAWLFPFIGRKVATPSGPGTLIQVFAERVTVLLDSERDKCSCFRPRDVEPVNCQL